ncbi:MAG: hypothetical protein QM809_01825 [Gordonia sp. (in: high G+C Gram-positive bacteria)]|uniref:hypothetical protein n=1 Tax=Gordonia sp. (in: high G+C Gram-positive bacteria) TaxID=84139 RepID=UPI0039E6A681
MFQAFPVRAPEVDAGRSDVEATVLAAVLAAALRLGDLGAELSDGVTLAADEPGALARVDSTPVFDAFDTFVVVAATVVSAGVSSSR